jgi:hypothetical protein
LGYQQGRALQQRRARVEHSRRPAARARARASGRGRLKIGDSQCSVLSARA